MGKQEKVKSDEQYESETSDLLEANILINKLRHLINHTLFMVPSDLENQICKANFELDKYFDGSGTFIETTGF